MRHAWGCAHDCNGDAFTECFACGNPVCTECSARVQYRHFGVQRVRARAVRRWNKAQEAPGARP